MSTFTLLAPFWIPITAVLILLARKIPHHSAYSNWQQVLSPALMQYFQQNNQSSNKNWNSSLILAAIATLALTAPSERTHTSETFQQSHGWIAVVDVSRSMTLTDVAPSRLGAVRNSLLDLSELSAGYPLSMVLFAGDAFLVAPPAFDKRLFNEQAALLEHGIVPLEGSNLARALSLVDSVVRSGEFISTRVFVYSDGGGISKSSIAAARHLSDNGHRVDLILTGGTINGQTPADIKDLQDFINTGQGDLITATALGAIDIQALSPNSWSSADSRSFFDALVWKNQSHWLLLLLVPFIYWVLREDFA